MSARTATLSGIEDIYKVVNRISSLPESMPEDEIEESAYDTLENVVKSIRTGSNASSFAPLPSPGVETTTKARDANMTSPEPPQPAPASIPKGSSVSVLV